MVPGNLLEFVAAQTVEARIADVGHGDQIVVEPCHDERRTHPRVLGLALGSVVYRLVGPGHLLADVTVGQALAGLLIKHLGLHVWTRPVRLEDNKVVAMPLATSPAL